MRNQKAKSWDLVWGSVFIILLGSALHFVFEWTGGWRPMALIAAVNESVWEHLKLAFWPAVIWSIMEFYPLRGKVKNFLLARTTALVLAPVIIVALFYAELAVTGKSNVFFDIGTFIVGVIISQWASYRLLSANQKYRNWVLPAAIVFALLLAMFATFTYYPPHCPFFQDFVGGGYGITE